MTGIEHIDHTGDIGLLVSAETLSGLFEKSAFGMFEVIAELKNVNPIEELEVRAEADDLEALFVRWLSEINFAHITQEKVYSKFQVDRLDEKNVIGRAWGEEIDSERHTIFTEVKAITYHDLRVEKKDGLWRARFIFDM